MEVWIFVPVSFCWSCMLDWLYNNRLYVHAFYCRSKKKSGLYAQVYFNRSLNPLSPLNIIWFSSVNKSNYKRPLNSGENKLYTFQFQPWKFYKIEWHPLEIPTRSKTKTHGNSTWVFKYPCGGNSFSYPPPPPPLFGFFCSPMPMGWWEVCNTSSSWFSWID